MLQQTQAERVIPFYIQWLKRWPHWKALSNAELRDVLECWSGLGYNRRAMYLLRTALLVMEKYNGVLPNNDAELLTLPGVGKYTARAVQVFAHNLPVIAIDTNVRRVLIHEFHLAPATSDKELETIGLSILPTRKSRVWHNALMDYSRLRLPIRLERVPPGPPQERFQGSIRQIRGELIRQVLKKKSVSLKSIATSLGRTSVDVSSAAMSLELDGFLTVFGNRVRLNSQI